MQACDGVFHLAGYAKNWARNRITFDDVNVGGLCNLLHAAREADVPRVVWTSTVMTFGPTPPGQVCDETYDRTGRPCYTDYERSKIRAEAVAREHVDAGQDIVICNPTRVFGPGLLTEGNSLTRLIDDYDQRRAPVVLNRGRNVGNFVLVDDVVQGHELAMQHGRNGERYILGGENMTMAAFFDLVDEISGKEHFRLPGRPTGAFVFAYIQLWKALLLGGYPLITTPWIRTFLSEWAYSSDKAKRELGYHPTPLREAVHLTYNWLLKQRVDSVDQENADA
jgi:farnesol dehydrogenase